MGRDLFNPTAAELDPVSLPESLKVAMSRALARTYSGTFTAPSKDIEAAASHLPAAKSLLAPASAGERDVQFGILAQQPWFLPVTLRSGNLSERTVFFASYHADLGEVPADVLADACRSARMNVAQTGLPTTGELMDYCRRSLVWKQRLSDAEALRRVSVAKPYRVREEATPEQWDDLNKRLAALKGTQ